MQMVSIQKIFFGKKNILKKTAILNNFVSLQKVYVLLRREHWN